ncbi:MAG: MFS transporter, partial [Glaciimonas sp.]|nr:MFS transporter [Glaciimonas sp.]
MSTAQTTSSPVGSSPTPHPDTEQSATKFRVLGAISFAHFLNDMIQSLILSIYPMLKGNFNLSF